MFANLTDINQQIIERKEQENILNENMNKLYKTQLHTQNIIFPYIFTEFENTNFNIQYENGIIEISLTENYKVRIWIWLDFDDGIDANNIYRYTLTNSSTPYLQSDSFYTKEVLKQQIIEIFTK